MRLTRARQFDAVFAAGVRAAAGPLVVWAAPNDVGHPRRNRIRRLVRESFRMLQHDLFSSDRGYDLVIGARRHEPLALAQYEQAMRDATRAVERSWSKKLNRSSRNGSA